MSDSEKIAELVAQLEHLDISDGIVGRGGLKKPGEQLRDVEFRVSSPNADVNVFMTADGVLADVVMPEGTLDRVERQSLEALVVETVRRAEAVLREAGDEVLRRRDTDTHDTEA
ncbi:MAG: YbaB/EbfC family nucleoid-associated protein [Stackebrandtia sp.]